VGGEEREKSKPTKEGEKSQTTSPLEGSCETRKKAELSGHRNGGRTTPTERTPITRLNYEKGGRLQHAEGRRVKQRSCARDAQERKEGKGKEKTTLEKTKKSREFFTHDRGGALPSGSTERKNNRRGKKSRKIQGLYFSLGKKSRQCVSQGRDLYEVSRGERDRGGTRGVKRYLSLTTCRGKKRTFAVEQGGEKEGGEGLTFDIMTIQWKKKGDRRRWGRETKNLSTS